MELLFTCVRNLSRVNRELFAKIKDIRSNIDTLRSILRSNRVPRWLECFAEPGNRLSRSGGSEDSMPIMAGSGYLQLNALNLQSSAPVLGDNNYNPSQRRSAIRGGWVCDEQPRKPIYNSFVNSARKQPPRILEALPSYPQGDLPLTSFKSPFKSSSLGALKR